MRNLKFFGVASLVATAMACQATIFDDVTGDVLVGDFNHLDIDNVEVTNTLTDITFVINLVGDPLNPNWGKYNVIMRHSGATTDDSDRNGAWGRNYGLIGGANGFIGTWTDALTDNQQNWSHSGGWNLNSTATNGIGSNSVTVTASLADLGITLGDTITFDVVSTGGGNDDTAVDFLSGQSPSNWGDLARFEGVNYEVVPEPATMTLLGLGALAALRRKRKA